jgi:MYXO-CTERM domain-containing protein
MPVRFCALVAICGLACADQPDAVEVATSKVIRHPGSITGKYIVVLEPAAGVDRLATLHGAAIEHRYASVLHGFSARMSAADAAALADAPGVVYVEEDTPVHASAVQTNPTYGLDRIDQPSLPLDGKFSYATAGAGTTVFVIDTGINTTHVELTGRLNLDLARTAIDDGNGIEDCNGHGTHVAGTVGGTVFGVAKQTTIVPIRVLDCEGSGETSGVIAGMDYVAANHPARSVVNMSLGGAAGEAKDAAVRNLVAMGVTVVVAAGNETTDACNGSPAREPMAITVASSTASDTRSSFSNYGTCVDLFAPGSNITSAWIDADNAINTISGTSMASPHVAGAAALYLAQNPNATPAQVTAALVGSTVQNKISDVQGSPNRLLQTTFTTQPPPGDGVMITKPANNAEVPPSFEVTVEASGAARVDLVLDGGAASVSDTTPPFAFNATNLTPGMHQLTATATDSAGTTSTQTIMVSVKSVSVPVGNNPVPPPTRHDEGGCTAAGSPSGWWALLVAMLFVRRRRREFSSDPDAAVSIYRCRERSSAELPAARPLKSQPPCDASPPSP